jgi:O-antigen ligase
MGMCVAVPLMFKDREELFKVLRFFLIATVAMGIIELLAASHLIPLRLPAHRFTSFMSATQGAILAMPFIFFFSTIKFIKKAPLTTYAASAFCFFASFWSASRGVWLGLIACITIVISFLDLKRKVLVTFIVLLLALFIFVFSKSMVIERYDMNIIDRFKTLVDTKQSTASWRLEAWWQMLQDIKENPVVGCPFGTPSTFYVFSAGYAQEHAPHNEFLKITRYTGLLGFGAFMVFIIRIFTSGFQYMQRNKQSRNYYEMLGFLMCFLFHCVTAMFTQAFTTMDRSPLVWAIPGIITLYLMLEKEDKFKSQNLKIVN